MTSRSRFYVDTPRDPSQRHSMFVSQSELVQRQDLSSNSSSATLPSTAGSVDRLTGLDEKKSSRFFTLKPKTSFSLRPFFRSTSSLISQSPGKRRKALFERRDSCVQTEETRPEFGDVGVQTLNASTVDVPVQTCLETWDGGNSYGQKRLAYATPRASPFWSQPSATTSALSNPLLSKNVAKDPLASPKLIKYAAPGDSQQTALHHQSADSPVNVNSCQSVSSFSPSKTSAGLQSVPVKYFAAKQLTSNTSSLPNNQENQSDNYERINECDQSSKFVPLSSNKSESETDEKSPDCGTLTKQGYEILDNQSSEVSNNLKRPVSQIIECPLSALKSERTDSPSRRFKTVHFDLPKSEPIQIVDVSSKPRNVDKDFEDLLKNLNILTENGNDLSPPLSPISHDKREPSVNLISPSLKSALDSLREDFLAPIPENLNEFYENEPDIDSKLDTPDSVNKNKNLETAVVSPTSVASKELTCPAFENVDQNLVEENKNDSLTPTSLSIFASAKSSSNPETDSLEGNVYDNVIKEEISVKTVTLPTLPSFFETPQPQTVEISSLDEDIKLDNCEPDKDTQSIMSLETESDSNKLSRSSSRSSFRSNSKFGNDSYREPISKFDSCENLDQLEEEIIRSLYNPDDEKMEEKLLKNIELPPSESFQNSGTTATHMRRVILDQLLSGKSVEDIVPNYPVYKRAHSLPESESKLKQPTKYTAVLTKMNFDENDSKSFNITSDFKPKNIDLVVENFSTDSKNLDLTPVKQESVTKIDSPKRTSSLFIFPEDSISFNDNLKELNLEISTSGNEKKSSSILEVRRSSLPPQTHVESNSDTVRSKTSLEKEISDNKSEHCDFTNCLLPSKIQNSPFLAKINTRSMSPCNFSPLSYQSSSPVNNNTSVKANSPTKPPAVGECDFASCLKPSQVQNSVFTAELSEITAGKSTNSLRVGSPLTVRTHSPLSARSNSLEVRSPVSTDEKDCIDECLTEPPNHKSEISITLQTAAKSSNNNTFKSEMPPILENIDSSSVHKLDISKSDKDSSISSDLQQETKVTSNIPLPPPPPPPPEISKIVTCPKDTADHSMDTILQVQRLNLTPVRIPVESGRVTPKTPIMIELEQKFHNKNDSNRRNSGDKADDQCSISSSNEDESTTAERPDIKLNGISANFSNGNQNGSFGYLSEPREYASPIPNGKKDSHLHDTSELTFSPSAIITDQPPPLGAVLLDKKVTVDGDKVHTDKVFAIPVKEVLKEKTSTTKFIPAPPKYEGIGPTEDGIPIGLRNSVKKENMHNWYKTMFKSLHKADSSNDPQEYIIGYTSEPETSKKASDMIIRKKSSTLDNRSKHEVSSHLSKQNYPPSAKSSIEVYNIHPRLIEDYEPGDCSITDDQVTISKRYLPSRNTVKPSYEYKNGYESDSNITKKRDQPEGLNPEQQKMWYREIQKGGEIPPFGLGKTVPEKPKDPTIGPLPPPPLNYSTQPIYQQAVRPSTLPPDYSNQNGTTNGYSQQLNGAYEMQLRHAIHSEMQQRMSPSSNQLSPPNRTMMKSPSRSPDMKVLAKALFDFKAESPKEIPLKKGDTVLIFRQLDKNWYEGERNGVIGIFPISYVEIIPPEHVAAPPKVRTEGLGRALYDFVAQTAIELTVRKGDTITLLKRVDANWFEGIFNNKKGIVPISYIQVLQEPIDKNMNSPSQKSYSVSPSSENQERLLKPISPSSYSPNSTSPLPAVLEKRKLTNKKSSSLVEPVMYRALYSYSPQNSDELELQEGDNVYVVEMCDDGWYVGTSVRNGVFGIFPGNYVEKVC